MTGKLLLLHPPPSEPRGSRSAPEEFYTRETRSVLPFVSQTKEPPQSECNYSPLPSTPPECVVKRKSVCVCTHVCACVRVCALWQQNNRRKLWAAWKTQQGAALERSQPEKSRGGNVMFGSLTGSPDDSRARKHLSRSTSRALRFKATKKKSES